MLKHIPQAIFVSLLAAGVTFLSNATGIVLWAVFVGWASYFLAGHTIEKGVRTFLNLLVGVGAGMLIAWLGMGSFASFGVAAFPAAVFASCFLMIMSEEFKFYPFTNRAAWQFVGAATFFATGFGISIMTLGQIALAFGVGTVCGILTVAGRTVIAKSMGMPEPFAEPRVSDASAPAHSKKHAA